MYPSYHQGYQQIGNTGETVVYNPVQNILRIFNFQVISLKICKFKLLSSLFPTPNYNTEQSIELVRT